MLSALPTTDQNQMPWISIIIPVLNEFERVASLANTWAELHGFSGVEVILVDGTSNDGTLEYLQKHAFKVISSSPGRARQMNKGAQYARGQLLWFLHCDTWPFNFDFQSSLNVLQACQLESFENKKLLWGRFDIYVDDPRFIFRIIGTCMNIRSRITSIATGDQGLFVCRELWQKVGGFPDLSLMEDIALCELLVCYEKPKLLQQRLVTSARRWQEKGILKTILLMWRLRYAFWRGADVDKLAAKYK